MNKFNLLYLEDDIEVRENVLYFLDRFFENIYTPNDGEEAYSMYLEQKIDFLLLDINVPKINGIQFAKKIREKDKKIPIVFLTAYSDRQKLLEAIKIGVTSYIVKPFDIKELLDTVRDSIYLLSQETKIANEIELGKNLFWDKEKRNLLFENESISLTHNEILLSELFIKSKNKIFTPDEIIDELFYENNIQANTITQLISRFKRKIIKITENDNFFIENIYKKGYKLR